MYGANMEVSRSVLGWFSKSSGRHVKVTEKF